MCARWEEVGKYFGTYSRSLDEKRRLQIPSRLAKFAPGATLFALQGFDGALAVYDEEGFQKKLSELEGRDYLAQDARADGRSRRAHRRLLGHFGAGEKRFFERLRLRAAHHGNAGKSVFFRRGAGRGNFAHFKKNPFAEEKLNRRPRGGKASRSRSQEKPRAGGAAPHIQRLTRKKMKVTTAKSAMTPSVTK